MGDPTILTCKRIIFGGLAAALLATAPFATVLAKEEVPARMEAERVGGLGSYLAARFASSQADAAAASDYFITALQFDPENLNLLRNAFRLSLASGRADQAVTLARRLDALEEEDGDLPDSLLILDDIAQGRHEAARARLDGLPREGFAALMGPIMEAWALASADEKQAALLALNPLDEITGFRWFGTYHRALILDYFDDVEAAKVAYENMLASENGGHLRGILAFGNLLTRMGRTKEALALFEGYLDRFPNNAWLLEGARNVREGEQADPFINGPADGLAEAYFGTGRVLGNERSRSSAIIYLRIALFLRNDFPQARFLLGDLLSDEGLYEASLETLKPLQRNPLLGRAVRMEMADSHDLMGQPDKALEILLQLAREKEGDLSVMSTLADIYRGEQRYKEALPWYNKVLKAIDTPEPRHWVQFYARGITYEQLDRWSRAEADFKSALKLQPDNPLVLNYLGYSWIEKGRNLEEALEMVQRAVELRPEDGYIVDSLGWAHYKLGNYDQAAEWLEQAVTLQPDDPTINDHLGDAYWKVGRTLEARFQWQHALDLSEDPEMIEKIQAKLERGLDGKGHARR